MRHRPPCLQTTLTVVGALVSRAFTVSKHAIAALVIQCLHLQFWDSDFPKWLRASPQVGENTKDFDKIYKSLLASIPRIYG